MSRTVYRLVMALVQPIVLLRVLWRSVAEPLYRYRWLERWGVYRSSPTLSRPVIWVHAVSLGETLASRPLLVALRAQYPNAAVLLTHWTATGRAAGAALLTSDEQQVWAPWDTPGNVARFLNHFKPMLGVLVETEVWPDMVQACHQRNIPLVLVNARMSQRSLNRAQRMAGALATRTFSQLTLALPQSTHDKARLEQLSARCSAPLGNMKFDHVIDTALQALGRQWRQAAQRPVVVVASTREGEEALWLQALREVAATSATAVASVQWLVVPRHPQRFTDVAQLMRSQGWEVSCRSRWQGGVPPASHQVPTMWLGDSMGEMAAYYTLADCAVMGGTFLPFGGQNLIEACHYDCPVVLGPSTFNFSEAARWAVDSGGAQSVSGMAEALAVVLAWVNNPEVLQAHRLAAKAFAFAHSGASARTMAELKKIV